MTFRRSAGVWAYRALLCLYPPPFRRTFGDEMQQDFELGLDEARAAGARASRVFLARALGDLLWSVPLQWLRSSRPILVGAAIVVPVLWGSARGSHAWRRTARSILPVQSPHPDVLWLVLLSTVAVLLVAATIILTVLFASPHLRRRSRAR